MLRLQGKVAIITGASTGIGEAAARLFANHGATVVVADIQDEIGRSVAASIGADKCSFHHCDVTDEKQVEEVVASTVGKHSRLDIMFSNAGVLGPAAGILDVDLTAFDNVLAVNLRGAAACIKHAGRAMSARGGGGSIICTASVSSTNGGLGPALYTASKHGLVGLARAAAGELGANGVRVNCVSPFGVATPLSLSGGMTAATMEAMCCEQVPLKGPVLRTKQVAEAALFLASDESEFITGHNLILDGGCTVYTVPKYDLQQLLAKVGNATN